MENRAELGPWHLQPNAWRQNGVTRWLINAALVSAVVVLLGSLDVGTTRRWEAGAAEPGIGAMEHREGAARWPGWTGLCGLVAIGMLLPVTRGRFDQHLDVGLLGLLTTLAALTVAAVLANQHWRRLLAEPEDRAYELQIAHGLPIVAIGGAFGAALCLGALGTSLGFKRFLHQSRRSVGQGTEVPPGLGYRRRYPLPGGEPTIFSITTTSIHRPSSIPCSR